MPQYVLDEVKPTVTNGDERGVILALQEELDGYWFEMRGFAALEPSDVMLKLSSFGARAGELRARLIRSESRLANGFRIRQLDPFLEQLEFQFKVHSRLVAVRTMEWDMVRGQG